MAAAGYSTNLGIPAMPQTQDQDAFQELLLLYRAVQVLQGALDQYTGVLAQPQEVWSQIPPQATLIASNLFRLYRLFEENVLAGQMVAINFTGGIVLAGAAAGRKCRGWSTGNVTAGNYGEIICFGGTITYPGTPLVPGDTYWLGNALGTIASAPGAPLAQVIGYGITTSILAFMPQTV